MRTVYASSLAGWWARHWSKDDEIVLRLELSFTLLYGTQIFVDDRRHISYTELLSTEPAELQMPFAAFQR